MDCSELVHIFLWEKDPEAAWREANAGGCDEYLWTQLAAEREREHPEDALPIYRRQIEPTLSHTNNEAYRQAVELLRKIHALMKRIDQLADFETYLESVRGANKRKRNFVKMLDRAKW